MRNLIVASLILTVGVTLGSVAILSGQSSESEAEFSVIPAAKTGRYQIYMHHKVRADQYLLDTQNGTVWTKVSYTNLKGDPELWVQMHRVQGPEELRRLIQSGVFAFK